MATIYSVTPGPWASRKFYILWPFLFPLIAVRKRGLLLLAAMPLLACGGPSMTRGYIGILFGVIAALAIQQDDRGVAFIRKVPTSPWAGLMVVGYLARQKTGNLYLNLMISLPATVFIAALINKENDFYQMALSFRSWSWLSKLALRHIFDTSCQSVTPLNSCFRNLDDIQAL